MSSKFEVRRSKIHGSGVFAAKNIKKGEFIIEYKGLLRSHEEVDAAYDGEDETGHTFLFTLNEDFVLDANIKGNEARWINHSCDPNCDSEHIDAEDGDKSKDRIEIKAIRDIKAGDELSYNYGIRLVERHTSKLKKLWACLCGSPKCTGTMLQPKRG
ncbi:SET domain-containing protein [Arenimonas sp.]|jgi:SET domain-containing protein|uniref:SET domain-containing protein n=1 Tax=Arenimonas sp. TaxID=1872635 RepID=UPI0037C05A71